MNVANKTVLLTGAIGGLGSKMAQILAKNGAIVFLLDVQQEAGEDLARKIQAEHGRAHFLSLDVTSEAQWAHVVDEAVQMTGRLDVLVNNAGINIRKPIQEMSMDEWMKMMQVNTGGVFLGCKYTIPTMKKLGGGVIINTSSVCGLIGHKYTPEAYTASKGAVTLLTRSIAARYAKDGIRCNSIHPSTVDTPLLQAVFQDPARKQERIDEVPLGRLATAEDVANAVLFLASEEASFLNGIALPVDGGVTCC